MIPCHTALGFFLTDGRQIPKFIPVPWQKSRDRHRSLPFSWRSKQDFESGMALFLLMLLGLSTTWGGASLLQGL